MIPRLAARRPLYQCLHASTRPPHPNTRQRMHTRPNVDAMLRQAQGRPMPGRGLNPALDTISTHRANAIELARLKKRRNWLALGAALSMIAPIFLVKLWDLPDLDKDKQALADANESRGIVDMVVGPPTKTDSPRKAADEFQGKRVVIAAGDKVIAAPVDAENPQASDPDAVELVETGSSYVPYFPRIIEIPDSPSSTSTSSSTSSSTSTSSTSSSTYQLLGLGIRKVSFLRVQVYVVGLYVKTADLSALQNHLINTVNPSASALIPGEKDDLRAALLDPTRSTAIWESLLAATGPAAVNMAFRIVPCRGTDFKHLQDGWMRGIAFRTDEVRRKQADLLRQQAVESRSLALPQPVDTSEFADDSFGLAMKDFKSIFTAKGKAPKGSIILLTRDKIGTLTALYQPLTTAAAAATAGSSGKANPVPPPPTLLGEVKDPRVSRLLWLLYLGGENVSSEDARRSVVDGCVAVTERPVGTVEGMVV